MPHHVLHNSQYLFHADYFHTHINRHHNVGSHLMALIKKMSPCVSMQQFII